MLKKKLAENNYLYPRLVLVLILTLYLFKGLFVAAMVNGQPIGRLTVVKSLEQTQGSQILDSLIAETLVIQEAKKRGIVVSQEEVDQKVAELEESLQSQGQDLTTVLAYQSMTLEELKRQIELQFMVEKLLADEIQVTDEEVEEYFQENKDYLSAEDLTDEELRQEAKEQLEDQKLSQAFQAWILEAKNQARIQYFVNY